MKWRSLVDSTRPPGATVKAEWDILAGSNTTLLFRTRRRRQIRIECIGDHFPAAIALLLPHRQIFAVVADRLAVLALNRHLVFVIRVGKVSGTGDVEFFNVPVDGETGRGKKL